MIIYVLFGVIRWILEDYGEKEEKTRRATITKEPSESRMSSERESFGMILPKIERTYLKVVVAWGIYKP